MNERYDQPFFVGFSKKAVWKDADGTKHERYRIFKHVSRDGYLPALEPIEQASTLSYVPSETSEETLRLKTDVPNLQKQIDYLKSLLVRYQNQLNSHIDASKPKPRVKPKPIQGV